MVVERVTTACYLKTIISHPVSLNILAGKRAISLPSIKNLNTDFISLMFN
jgi:hypothetical protein